MPRRKKHAVRKGRGVMCNICGKNCGKGGALKKHIEGAHDIKYDDYKKCFHGENRTIVFNDWNVVSHTSSNQPIMTHILVSRIIGNPGPRGVAKKI
jgi:hypothetical protein